MTGSPRTFDLWFVRPEEVQGPVLLERFRALLTTEERARNQRFRQERHRHQDLVTRALVRHVLSQYATDLHPAEWIFSENHHGKPAIAGPAGAPRLSFNLSHTDGMLLCGVTQHHPVGVDVERIDRKTDVGAIADRFFSESEVNALLTLPEHAQTQRFFDYWTLKEAYIKARGLGLALPLGDFSFAILDAPAASVAGPVRPAPCR